MAVADLKTELETLHYREHKKLAIQGQITAVRFIKPLQTTETQGVEEVGVRDFILKCLYLKLVRV